MPPASVEALLRLPLRASRDGHRVARSATAGLRLRGTSSFSFPFLFLQRLQDLRVFRRFDFKTFSSGDDRSRDLELVAAKASSTTGVVGRLQWRAGLGVAWYV